MDRGHQLAVARAVLAATGKSPRQLGRENEEAVRDWVYQWGFTSSQIIQDYLERTSGRYAGKLAKKGLLVETKTQSGTPQSIFTLSQQGLELTERGAFEVYPYPEIDPYYVRQDLLRHNLLAQQVTLEALRNKTIRNFLTERMIDHHPSVKRPDVVWYPQAGGLPTGVEIELSAKWGRRLDQFVLGTKNAIDSGWDRHYNGFLILSDSPAILTRYKEAMQPNALLTKWKKDDRNRWVAEEVGRVPDWLISKVRFELLK